MIRELSAYQVTALQYAADGMPVKTVARKLGISVDAAKSRRRSAVRRIGAATTPAAVALAMRAGIVR